METPYKFTPYPMEKVLQNRFEQGEQKVKGDNPDYNKYEAQFPMIKSRDAQWNLSLLIDPNDKYFGHWKLVSEDGEPCWSYTDISIMSHRATLYKRPLIEKEMIEELSVLLKENGIKFNEKDNTLTTSNCTFTLVTPENYYPDLNSFRDEDNHDWKIIREGYTESVNHIALLTQEKWFIGC